MPSETVDKNMRVGTGRVSRIPAYQRIEDDIRTKVRDGRLPAGSMLASRHNLAREYGVALSTAQQAIANLLSDGTLETFDRRGTFVSQPAVGTGHAAGLPLPASSVHTDPTGALSGATLHTAAAPTRSHTTSATLGIVATARVDPALDADVGSLWMRLAIRSLEHSFSAAGGATRFFDRYPIERGPYPRGLDEANAIRIREAIAELRADGCSAIAVVGLCDAPDMSDEVIAAVDLERVPTVYISWHEVQPPLAQVYYDNRFAGYQAAQHLIRRGYRDLLFLAPFSEGWLAERLEGARSAVRHAQLSDRALRRYPDALAEAPYDRAATIACVHDLAAQLFGRGWESLRASSSGQPFAIIAPNDDTALAVIDAAAEHGRSPGRDFGLVGFDDDPRACVAGLSTVRPPIEAMGEEAGRILLRALHGERRSELVRLRSHLIPRASTGLRSR